MKEPVGYGRRAALVRRLKREGYTMLGARHARTLLWLAEDIERRGVPGVLVDCGVWNGGSTILLSRGAPSREVWAFDSFEGMPEPGALDDERSHDWVGECRGSEAKLGEGFERYADPTRLHVAKGWFEDSLPKVANEIDSIAVLHIDADWYESVRLALATLYPKLSEGGYVAVDDYKTWTGARRAVDELRARERVTSPIISSYHWRE